MPLFRKKPIVIEAVQYKGRLEVFKEWMDRYGSLPFYVKGDGLLAISTLEGDMIADLGDWIIRGISGEFYPCKPDVFDMAYEPA